MGLYTGNSQKAFLLGVTGTFKLVNHSLSCDRLTFVWLALVEQGLVKKTGSQRVAVTTIGLKDIGAGHLVPVPCLFFPKQRLKHLGIRRLWLCTLVRAMATG